MSVIIYSHMFFFLTWWMMMMPLFNPKYLCVCVTVISYMVLFYPLYYISGAHEGCFWNTRSHSHCAGISDRIRPVWQACKYKRKHFLVFKTLKSMGVAKLILNWLLKLENSWFISYIHYSSNDPAVVMLLPSVLGKAVPIIRKCLPVKKKTIRYYVYMAVGCKKKNK